MAGWQSARHVTLQIARFPFLLVWRLLRFIWEWLLYPILYPFIYVSYTAREVLAWPFRFLAQFEALWYFLSCAILVGVVFGGVAYAIVKLFVFTFDLDRSPIPKPIPARGHDAISYREARAKKRRKEKEKEERHAMRVKLLASESLIQEVVREARSRPVTLTSPISPNTATAATRSGLFQDIILEQTDEEDNSAF